MDGWDVARRGEGRVHSKRRREAQRSISVFVCVWQRERERNREREKKTDRHFTSMEDLPTVLPCLSKALESFLWDTICWREISHETPVPWSPQTCYHRGKPWGDKTRKREQQWRRGWDEVPHYSDRMSGISTISTIKLLLWRKMFMKKSLSWMNINKWL